MTILVDFTPLVDGRGPARLLDMRPGRSADVLSGWLKERDPSFREQIQVVTMDGFTGYATAVEEQLPQADKVMDPFHVVPLAADKLTSCRQRLQRETTGRRGRKDDPLYKHRRTLLARTNYLTDRQKQRLDMLWATELRQLLALDTDTVDDDEDNDEGRPEDDESTALPADSEKDEDEGDGGETVSREASSTSQTGENKSQRLENEAG